MVFLAGLCALSLAVGTLNAPDYAWGLAVFGIGLIAAGIHDSK